MGYFQKQELGTQWKYLEPGTLDFNSGVGGRAGTQEWGSYTDSPCYLQSFRNNNARTKGTVAKKTPKPVVGSVGEKEHPSP